MVEKISHDVDAREQAAVGGARTARNADATDRITTDPTLATTPGTVDAPRRSAPPPLPRDSRPPAFSMTPVTTSIPSVRREAWRAARVLLIHDDAGSADALAQEIRNRGGIVVVSGRSAQGVLRARELDPEMILVDSESVVGPSVDIVETLDADTRLKWANRVVVQWDEVWPAIPSVAHMDRLAERVMPLRRQEETVLERSEAEPHFSVSLAPFGPCRLVRALATSTHVLALTIATGSRRIEVELADGLVASSSVFLEDAPAPALEGLEALALWMEVPEGVVEVVRAKRPRRANILLPVEVALATAAREHGSQARGDTLGAEQKTRSSLVPEAPPAQAAAPQRGFVLDPYGSDTVRDDLDMEGVDREHARAIVDGLPRAPAVPSEAPSPTAPSGTSLTGAGRGVALLAAAAAVVFVGAWAITSAVSGPAADTSEPARTAPSSPSGEVANDPSDPEREARPDIPPATPAPATPAHASRTASSPPTSATGETAEPAVAPLTQAPAAPSEAARETSRYNDSHALYDDAKRALREGRATDAVRLAERLVSLRRRRSEYRALLGDAYRAAGRSADAEREYEEAAALERYGR